MAWLLVTIAVLGVDARPASAAGPDLVLICPGKGGGDPRFEDKKTGTKFPISNPQIAAVAVKACEGTPPGDTHSSVQIVNRRNTAIYVGFTTIDHEPGPITWGHGCTPSGNGAMIAAGAACVAGVVNDGVATRFCAALDKVPADCFDAQADRQTMIETNFEPASNPGCFNQGKCVWFDISVVPAACTDALWKQDRCANTGGASYNLPVSVACAGKTIYTCRGPQNNTYGPANYPSNCGNPDATCQSAPKCQNAYFYPMFDPPENKYQPNSVCLDGRFLSIKFLPGP